MEKTYDFNERLIRLVSPYLFKSADTALLEEVCSKIKRLALEYNYILDECDIPNLKFSFIRVESLNKIQRPDGSTDELIEINYPNNHANYPGVKLVTLKSLLLDGTLLSKKESTHPLYFKEKITEIESLTPKIIKAIFKEWPTYRDIFDYNDIGDLISYELAHNTDAKVSYHTKLTENEQYVFDNIIRFIASNQRLSIIN